MNIQDTNLSEYKAILKNIEESKRQLKVIEDRIIENSNLKIGNIVERDRGIDSEIGEKYKISSITIDTNRYCLTYGIKGINSNLKIDTFSYIREENLKLIKGRNNIEDIQVRIYIKFDGVASRNGHKSYSSNAKVSIDNWVTSKSLKRYTVYQSDYIAWYDYKIDDSTNKLLKSHLKHHYNIDEFDNKYKLVSLEETKTIIKKDFPTKEDTLIEKMFKLIKD